VYTLIHYDWIHVWSENCVVLISCTHSRYKNVPILCLDDYSRYQSTKLVCVCQFKAPHDLKHFLLTSHIKWEQLILPVSAKMHLHIALLSERFLTYITRKMVLQTMSVKMILPVSLTGKRYVTNISWKWVPQSMSMQMLLQDFLISERQPLLNCNLISIVNYVLSYTHNITRQRDFLILNELYLFHAQSKLQKKLLTTF